MGASNGQRSEAAAAAAAEAAAKAAAAAAAAEAARALVHSQSKSVQTPSVPATTPMSAEGEGSQLLYERFMHRCMHAACAASCG